MQRQQETGRWRSKQAARVGGDWQLHLPALELFAISRWVGVRRLHPSPVTQQESWSIHPEQTEPGRSDTSP